MLEMTIDLSAAICTTHRGQDEQCFTASAGFSVANLDILAMSSFRLSGGNMLSSHADPLFSMPPTDP